MRGLQGYFDPSPLFFNLFFDLKVNLGFFLIYSLPLSIDLSLPSPLLFSGNPPTFDSDEISDCETGSSDSLSFWRQQRLVLPPSLFVMLVSFSSSIFFYPLYFSFYSLFFPLLSLSLSLSLSFCFLV